MLEFAIFMCGCFTGGALGVIVMCFMVSIKDDLYTNEIIREAQKRVIREEDLK